MKIFKTIVMIEDDGSIGPCDTIQYEGRLWLVPEWLEVPSEQKTVPTRIIGLAPDRFQKPNQKYRADYFLTGSISKALLAGQIPIELKGQVVVIERPDIKIQAGGGIH
jgi:hypothetical protein